MAELTHAAVERVVLLTTSYRHLLTSAMAAVAPDPELIGEAPLVVLCCLDRDGPCRPSGLQDVCGLSSGGVSKLLDRMEQAGVVNRTPGGVSGDHRGVVVSITRRGRALLARFSREAAARLPDGRAMVKQLSAALDDVPQR